MDHARAGIPFEATSATFFGPGIGNQPSHDTLLRETIGIMDACTRAIANRIATLEFVVKEKRPVVEGSLSKVTLDDHPLKELLDKPHPDISRFQFLRVTTQWIVEVGESYWYKERGRFGPPVRLQLAPPGQVRTIVNRGIVAGYEVTEGGGTIRRYPRDAFVRMFMPDPENMWGLRGHRRPCRDFSGHEQVRRPAPESEVSVRRDPQRGDRSRRQRPDVHTRESGALL